MSGGRTLKVPKIKNGTVIDHIRHGKSLKVCQILGILPRTTEMVTIAMNVESKKMSIKDILKIEGRIFEKSKTDEIAIISPTATINIIENFNVVRKEQVQLPDKIIGLIKCPNSDCISNAPKEPVQSKFFLQGNNDNNPSFQCHYCYRIVETRQISKLII